MLNIIIAILILAVVLLRVFLVGEKTRKNAYKWWYIPWAGIIYVFLLYKVLKDFDLSSWPLLSYFKEPYQLEAIVSLLAGGVWLAILPLLKREKLFTSLTSLYRRVFAGKRSDKMSVLPYPYHIDIDGAVRSRVGRPFHCLAVKLAAVLVGLVYALYFVLLYFFEIEFYLLSAYGLLALIPIIEYGLYLSAEVPPEDEVPERGTTKASADFERLWRWYTGTFDDYSVAWMRLGGDRKEIKRLEDDNEEEFADLESCITSKHMDGIVENCDLTEAFIRIEPILSWTEKNGRHVLIALDIPSHFSSLSNLSYVDEIARNLRDILRKDFTVFSETSPRAALTNSIVIAPLSLISKQGLDAEWLSRIGLITVVNLFDKGVSNLYECRKFCFLLRAVNADCQFLFINPCMRGAEPSIKNTWLTQNQIVEKRMTQFLRADSRFYIGFNFENYKERFSKVLLARPSEPLYSGTELSVLALSSKIGDEDKPVTPVHYMDLAYSNIIEGKEELGKFRSQLKGELMKVSASDINQGMETHLLPVERIAQDSILAVIFDQDNNAPSAYAKWMHLGKRENFSIVVSRPYLFRDYFNSNLDYFVTVPFAALQPQLSKSRITLAIILLDVLRKTEGGVEERQLRALLRYYYEDKEIKSVPDVIRQLFDTYFSASLANRLQTSFDVTFEDGSYKHNTFYSLDIKDDISLSYLDTVSVRDESGNELFEILQDLLWQNYDPGQIHSFSGKPYAIKSFDEGLKTLKVSSSNNSDDHIVFYKPSLEVSVSGEKTPVSEIADLAYEWSHPLALRPISLRFEGFEAEVSVRTSRWYTFHSYSIVGGDCISAESHSPVRKYPRGKVLKVSMRFLPKPEYLRRIDDIRKGLQLLLYEAMQTVFPQHAQYLVISSLGAGDADLPWIFNSFHIEESPQDGVLSFYFIEDAHMDLGLIGALANKDNFSDKYLFRYIYDYLIWLTEGDKSSDRYSFLKYGRKSLPSYFDVDLLINFLRDFFCDSDQSLQGIGIDRTGYLDETGVCDFCMATMKNSEMQRLSDGRMRCPACSEDAVDTDSRFADLQRIAHDLFRRHLGIDFDTIPHKGMLVSAIALHKAGGVELQITNGYDARKFIGLASPAKETYYVENGRKSQETLGIIIHELTHIWEYTNESYRRLEAENNDWCEGLAVWTDLFLMDKYLQEQGLPGNFEERKGLWQFRNDEYGRGLRLIDELCPDDPYGYIRGK